VTEPLRFVFGVHLHQPVGNFDHVFSDHVRDGYRPFLERTAAAGFGPLTLHVSGPLFDWLDDHDPAFVDVIGRHVTEGRLELLLAGFDEPILASLPRDDRLEQILRMREYLQRRFGVAATGLWLTERVWEPELAADLANAGVGYALVDDRHFLATGFRRDQLHQPWRTESDGRAISLLAIDERLRYLIPFRPPEETAAYLRQLRAEGHALAVLADDGEKFGGWPGTHEWVYQKGWLDGFLRAMGELTASGEVRLATGAEAVGEIASGGLAYLPTASYREMEGWSLPAHAQQRLTALETELGEERLQGPDGGLVRGAHWRNFLVKYAESNRMHKTMVALSALARSRGDPPEARRAIGRAQCNDAYWHGVFGGLYLPLLRGAVWRQLAIAERALRRGEALACETLDLDADGSDELWLHSSAFSAVVSPRRGGAIEVFSRFQEEVNLADALTRRRESYHQTPDGAAGDLPPADLDVRAILVDRVLPGWLHADAYARAEYTPLASWAGTPMTAEMRERGTECDVALKGGGLEKTLTFTAAGGLRAAYRWDPAAFPADAVFAPELSLTRDVAIIAPGADVWSYTITTVAKSERGLEETRQGVAITPRWPVSLGQAQLEIPAP
jgi:alpha-amylase